MRHVIPASLLLVFGFACTHTQRHEAKEDVQSAWHKTKSGVSNAYEKATAVPVAERGKRSFEARHDTRLQQLEVEAKGLEEQASIYQFDRTTAFEKAKKDYDRANSAAKKSLAGLQSHELAGWEGQRAGVEAAIGKVNDAVGNLRNVTHAQAH